MEKMNYKTGLAVLAAVSAGAIALAGCSSPAPAPGSPNSPSVTGPGSESSALVVYAPMEGPRADWLTEHAKQELGLDITFVVGGGGDLTSRLIAEKNNSQADAIIGLGEVQMNQLAAEQVLTPYAPAWAEEIPAELRSASDAFTLYTQTPIVIGYNSAVMTADKAPAAWEDLAKPQFKEKFVFPGVAGQTGQAAVVGLLWPYTDQATGEVSDQGWELLKSVFANARPMAAGQNLDWNWVKSGDVPVLVNWLGGVETGAKDYGLTVEIVSPAAGTPFVSTGVAVAAGAKNPTAAQKFLDWYGSAPTQIAFVKATNNDTPLNPKALAELPDARASVEQVTKQPIDWTLVTPHLTEWMQKVQLEIVS